MKKITLIILAILKFTFFYPQEKNKHISTYESILLISDDTLKIKKMLQYTDSLAEAPSNLQSCIYLYKYIGEFSELKSQLKYKSIALFKIALIYNRKGDLTKSNTYFETILKEESLGLSQKFKADVLVEYAKNKQTLQLEKEALVLLNKALLLYGSVNDYEGIADVYKDLSTYARLSYDYKAEEKYFDLASEIYLEKKLTDKYSDLLFNRALTYAKQEKFDLVKRNLFKCIEIDSKNPVTKEKLISNYISLSAVYSKFRMFDSAYYCLNKVKFYADSLRLMDKYFVNYNEHLAYYYSMKKNDDKAIYFYKQAVNFYHSKNNPNVKYLFETIAEIFKDKKKSDSAYYYLNMASLVQDSIVADELNKNLSSTDELIDLMEKNFSNQRKILEAEKEKEHLEIVNVYLISVLIVFLFIIVLIIFYYRNYNLKKKKENLISQLDFLKAQLNPHFLFNSINNIYVLIDINPSKAASILMKFSELLRHQLYECDDTFIQLVKEIEFLKNFIELEKLRYEDKIKIDFKHSIPDNVDYKIAPLLLQPFIENAFKHTSKSKQSQSFIKINVSLLHNKLDFRIENNYSINEKANLPGGIGLDNVKKRLNLLYSGSYFLDIKNDQNTYVVYLTLDLKND